MYNKEVKNEAIRLRTEGRLSLKDVAVQVGISKSTASYWLRDYPLEDKEKQERYRRAGLASSGMSPGMLPKEESVIHKLRKGGNKLSSLQKARISEAAVLLRLFVRGYSVYGSSFDGDKLDWVVEDSSGSLIKVQVKSAKRARIGSPSISLLCSNGRKKTRRYKSKEFDIIVGYDWFSDSAFVWSFDELKGNKKSVSCSEESFERWDKLDDLLALPTNSGEIS